MTSTSPLDVQVVFDATDPHAVAAFWAQALGYEREDHTEIVDGLVAAGHLPSDEAIDLDGGRAFRDVAAASDPEGKRPRLFFQRVPEPKTVKNRVHLDIRVGSGSLDAEVARLTDLGATFAYEMADRGPRVVTMHDPEGNELCLS
ncbi:VOC family protein [soil metagenome]